MIAAGAELMTETMVTRPIPSTGEAMPVIGLGTWQVFDVGAGDAARRSCAEVLRLLLDGGGRMIDTSPMYGRAEAVTGDLLAESGRGRASFSRRRSGPAGASAGIEQMRRSAELLRSPVLDLIQIHNLLDWRTHLATLRRMKDDGQVRYIGITHYTTGSLSELARILDTRARHRFRAVRLFAGDAGRRDQAAAGRGRARGRGHRQPALRDRRHVPPGARAALPEWAAEFDCASWAQLFLKYLLAEPAVTCVIPATAKPEHMKDNLKAGFGRLPDAATREPHPPVLGHAVTGSWTLSCRILRRAGRPRSPRREWPETAARPLRAPGCG